MFISSFSTPTRPMLALHPHVTSPASYILVRRCPNCGADLLRVRRCPIDRLVSLIVPVRRFRCAECAWEGLVTKDHWHTSVLPVSSVTDQPSRDPLRCSATRRYAKW